MRRFTQLTNAFSKKVENLRAAVSAFRALQFCARAPDLARYASNGSWGSNRLWSLDELVERTSD